MSLIDIYQLSRNRLQHFLAPISRLFMACEPPYILHVFEPPPNAYRIPHWVSQIESMDQTQHSECSITRIDHRKNLTDKEHEFLVATITHTAGYRCYLKIHRCVESLSTSDSLTIGSTSVSTLRPALDCVQFIAEITTENESMIVGSVSFISPNPTPSIPNLSVLLSVVNAHATDYHPRCYNCYWFAHTVAEVLRRKYRGVDATMKLAQKAQRSKLSSIKIQTADSVEKVEEEYADALGAWMKKVKLSEDARRDALDQVRQQGRDEAHKQVQHEVDEARRQVQDARQREEDAQREVQNARQREEDARQREEEARLEADKIRQELETLKRGMDGVCVEGAVTGQS